MLSETSSYRRPTSSSSRSSSGSSGGWGDAVRRNLIAGALESTGNPVTAQTLNQEDRNFLNAGGGGQGGAQSYPMPQSYSPSYSGGGGGGGGWGGGGGGGGGGGLDQAKLDWMVSLLGQGGPEGREFNRLKLPKSKFRPQQYNQLMRRFNRAVGMDRRTANRAYGALSKDITRDYSNAFTNPNATYATMQQAPGMDQQAMARMMQSQGVDPSVAGAQLEGAAAADQGFKNLWNVLAANEDLAQRNRLQAVGTDRTTTNQALNVAALQGRTGIGLQKTKARDDWRTQRDARRTQQALANWQRRNQIGDLDATDANAYRNQVIQSMLGMIPGLAAGVNPPELSALFPGIGSVKAGPAKKKGKKGTEIGKGKPGKGGRDIRVDPRERPGGRFSRGERRGGGR